MRQMSAQALRVAALAMDGGARPLACLQRRAPHSGRPRARSVRRAMLRRPWIALLLLLLTMMMMMLL